MLSPHLLPLTRSSIINMATNGRMTRCHYLYLFLDLKIVCNLDQMDQKFCLATENCWIQNCTAQARNLWCRRHYLQINLPSSKVHEKVHNKNYPLIVLYIFPFPLFKILPIIPPFFPNSFFLWHLLIFIVVPAINSNNKSK